MCVYTLYKLSMSVNGYGFFSSNFIHIIVTFTSQSELQITCLCFIYFLE